MEDEDKLIHPLEWSCLEFQQCTSIPKSLILNLLDNQLEQFISIPLLRREKWPIESLPYQLNTRTNALCRLSKTGTNIADSNILRCDLRIRNVEIRQDLAEFISAEYGNKFNCEDLIIVSVLPDMNLDFWDYYKMVRLGTTSEADQGDSGDQSHVRILPAGVITNMTITLIIDDFRNSPHVDFNRSLSEVMLRDIFKSYGLHVTTNTLIDLRHCPFMSIFTPKVSFLFVHTCQVSKSQHGIGCINANTKITMRCVHDIPYFERLARIMPMKSIETCLPGLESQFRLLIQPFTSIPSSIKGNRTSSYIGFLISGPVGCGKKFLVEEIARRSASTLLNFSFSINKKLRLQPDTLCRDLDTIFENGCKTFKFGYPCIILLENVDSLHTKDDGILTTSFRNKRIVLSYLCQLIDAIGNQPCVKTPFVIVATTSKPYLVPEMLRASHRLQREIFINTPNAAERSRILKIFRNETTELEDLDLDNIARMTPGYVTSDLIRLLHCAVLQARENNLDRVSPIHIKYALSRVQPSILQGSIGVVDVASQIKNIEIVSGLDSIKAILARSIIWPIKHPDAFGRIGIRPPNGIMLYGPSGCGKTSLVRELASSYETNFLCVSGAELFSSAVGESEKLIAHLFHRARLASPSILFIDEIDAVIGSRDNTSSGKSVNEAILSMLLVEMDGIGVQSNNAKKTDSLAGQRVVVVGATNRPDMIDSALLRPGRFDRLIPVSPPDESGRLKLLTHCTKGVPLAEDVSLEDIASKTVRFSGADIVNLCREAALHALSRDLNAQFVDKEDYISVLDQLSPSISQECLDAFVKYSNSASSDIMASSVAGMKSLKIT